MECFICGREGRPRGFRRFRDDFENILQETREAVINRRADNNLPEMDFTEDTVIHQNCYRNIVIFGENEENEEGVFLNCVIQRRNYCFVCQQQGGRGRNLRSVPFNGRVQVYLRKDIFIPKHALCCGDHFEDGDILPVQVVDDLHGNERNIVMSPKETGEWFKALRTAAVLRAGEKYDSEENFEENDFQTLTKISRENFRDLFMFCDDVVVYDKNRTITKKDLMAFLMKVTQDLSDEVLKALLNFKSRQSVSLSITAVLRSLSRRFVVENLGPAAITRANFINNHVTEFANELYNPDPENRVAIIYIDGTYLKIEKSSNFRALRQSFCLHKGHHLIKPALVVAPDGYILDVHGPYFSDSRNNDAAMLRHEMELEQHENMTRLSNWLHANDVIIVDRGYRDAVDFVRNIGVECVIPPFLARGQRQFTTEEANTARLITKTRWIVEARNGHLKNIFKFLRTYIPYHHVSNCRDYLRIACALLNKYFPSIHMQGASVQLAQEMKRLAQHENVVRARVENERLHLQRIPNDRWINLDELALAEFPILTLQYLRDLTIGVYQLKLAPSYIQDTLQRENVEHFSFQILEEERGFLRCRIYSRFTQATKHQLWIAYVPQDDEDHEDDREGPIMGYYCTCKTGSRTVGCCAHISSVLWFLGFARHEANVKYPPTKLLHCLLDASERPLPLH